MEDNRCPGCMEIKDGTVCGHCGFDEEKQNEHHQLQIGTVLQEKYVVGRVLGQGGFGITYLCWNRYLERKVAIKEYYPSFLVERHTGFSTKVTCKSERMAESFAENRMRFLREAKLLAKLQDAPQIVSILDFFEANDTAYIVMEYLQGSDLKSYVRKKGGHLTPKETFSIMRPVMAALAQVHEAGLVHRDISPDNIMLQPDGSVKLMDFGAARSVNNPGVEKELTQATQAIVKHGFAPIEQYSAKGSIGPWTDEYALCATMYYCMTGAAPESVHDRIDEDKDIDWDRVEGLTEKQRQILRKGMEIRAKDRYRSIRELMADLFEQTVVIPQPPEPPQPPKTPAKGNRKGIAIIAGLACAVLALVLILGIGGGFGGKSQPEATTAYWEPLQQATTPPAVQKKTPIVTEPPERATTEPPEIVSPTPAPATKPCEELILPETEVLLVEYGEKWLIDVDVRPSNTTDELTFTSSNERIATVDSEGCITAMAEGECVITITCGKAQAEYRVICLGFGVSSNDVPTEAPAEMPRAPSEADILPFGEVIAYPRKDAYLPAYETMYVKSERGSSIYVYWKDNGASEYRRRFVVYEADEVTVLARQDGFSCIIFKDQNGNDQIGWVNSDFLVYQY